MKKHLFSSLAFTLAFLISFLSICFSSWISINPDTSKSFELSTTKDRVICYNSSTKIDYTSLKVALDSASDNQEIIVYIGADVVCDEDITIKKNVTLTIPFAGKAFDSLKKANNISSTTLYKIPDPSNRNDYGNKLGDESKSTVSIYRSCLIEMRNGADIINDGTLNLGGVCSTNGNNGYYSEINLGLASSIQCKSGSTFECYGYVKENEKDYSNPTNQEKEVFDNSLDAERYIKIESGASMISSLALYDAPSAGGLTTLLNAKKCPFWEWDFPNLQTYTKIEAGSVVSATALLVGPNNTPIEKQITLFSSNSKNQSMFYLSSGYVGIEYSTKEPSYSSRGFNARKANILLSGKISVGYLFVQEGSGSVGVKLDTREDFLPISCRMKMVIGRGTVFKTDKKIKFLADSSLLIQENGRFEINNEIIFHKKDSIYLDTNEGIYFRHKASDSIKDARLICNGTIIFNSDGNKNGAIGAYVEHCNSNGSACFDLSGLSEDSKLLVKATEGTNNMAILIASTGDFKQGLARFSSGNKYTSLYSQSKYFWNGPSVSTYNVKVKILKGTDRSIALYSLQYADDANGTNLKDSSLLNCETDGSTSLPGGKYAKINLIRGKTCVLKDSFGQIIASDLSSYFLLDRDYSIEITPNEAITVGLRIDSKNNKYNGCGHFTFDVYESKTKNSGFIQVDTIKASGCQANAVGNGYKEFYISKGYYFYIKLTFELDTLFGSIYNNFDNANATITVDSSTSTPAPWNPKKIKQKQSPTYYAEGNYKFKFVWNYR